MLQLLGYEASSLPSLLGWEKSVAMDLRLAKKVNSGTAGSGQMLDFVVVSHLLSTT